MLQARRAENKEGGWRSTPGEADSGILVVEHVAVTVGIRRASYLKGGVSFKDIHQYLRKGWGRSR